MPGDRDVGRLYGVSLGPGDPELMTRRAFALLSRPDTVWTYPIRSTKSDSYALAIAQRAGLQPPGLHEALLFPMTHDPEKLARHWLRAGQVVAALLESGQDVLFLVEGDASTYATFGYLARTVRELLPGATVHTVPGVTSFIASSARLGQPLSEQDDTVAIVPAAYGVEMVERLLDDFDTLVLMKVKPLIDELVDLLERRGLIAHSTFVEKAGAPEERIVHDVRTLRGTKVNYLSLLIVKNTGRQRGERIKGCKKKTTIAPTPVIPAQAGIHDHHEPFAACVDPGLRRGDDAATSARPSAVIPAQVGIQDHHEPFAACLDPGLRRGDEAARSARPSAVIPAQAGIHDHHEPFAACVDPGPRRGDEVVRSARSSAVIPAQAGIHDHHEPLAACVDPGLRRGDDAVTSARPAAVIPAQAGIHDHHEPFVACVDPGLRGGDEAARSARPSAVIPAQAGIHDHHEPFAACVDPGLRGGDEAARSARPSAVIPAQAGIQDHHEPLVACVDPGLRRGDEVLRSACSSAVIPAQAGIHDHHEPFAACVDPGLRRGDGSVLDVPT